MQAAYPLLALLAWQQFKHFVADYLLQPAWILEGKGKLRHPGGYAHAALHALGSSPALMVVELGVANVAAIAMGELVMHFTIDHLKAIHSLRSRSPMTARAFWAAHGVDQMLHHLTYTGILLLVS